MPSHQPFEAKMIKMIFGKVVNFLNRYKLRIVLYVSYLLTIGYFVYILSFSSGWAVGSLLGDFYTDAQVVNKILYKYGLYLVFAMVISMILQTAKSKKLYRSHDVVMLTYITLFGINAYHLANLLPKLKASYLELNEFMLELITAINYSKPSVFIFDLGILLSTVFYIFGGLLFVLWIIKHVEQVLTKKRRVLIRQKGDQGL